MPNISRRNKRRKCHDTRNLEILKKAHNDFVQKRIDSHAEIVTELTLVSDRLEFTIGDPKSY
jgi:hypothetical protein